MITPQSPPDPSGFYRLNEEIALEIQRLEDAGDLDRLLELLKAANVELHVVSARPEDGFEELLGALRPRLPGDEPQTLASRELPPSTDEAPEGCSGRDADAIPRRRGGWDHEGVLAVRSQFTVVLPGGQAREVYMPDHICPACRNDVGNAIDACSRICGSCKFAW